MYVQAYYKQEIILRVLLRYPYECCHASLPHNTLQTLPRKPGLHIECGSTITQWWRYHLQSGMVPSMQTSTPHRMHLSTARISSNAFLHSKTSRILPPILPCHQSVVLPSHYMHSHVLQHPFSSWSWMDNSTGHARCHQGIGAILSAFAPGSLCYKRLCWMGNARRAWRNATPPGFTSPSQNPTPAVDLIDCHFYWVCDSLVCLQHWLQFALSHCRLLLGPKVKSPQWLSPSPLPWCHCLVALQMVILSMTLWQRCWLIALVSLLSGKYMYHNPAWHGTDQDILGPPTWICFMILWIPENFMYAVWYWLHPGIYPLLQALSMSHCQCYFVQSTNNQLRRRPTMDWVVPWSCPAWRVVTEAVGGDETTQNAYMAVHQSLEMNTLVLLCDSTHCYGYQFLVEI